MSEDKDNRELAPKVDIRPGASMRLTYTERTVKVYCVFKSDLKQLTLLNTLANILFSCGSFSLAIVAAILVGWMMQNASTALNKTSILGIIIFGVLSAFFFAGGVWMMINQKTYWDEIGDTSREIPKDAINK